MTVIPWPQLLAKVGQVILVNGIATPYGEILRLYKGWTGEHTLRMSDLEVLRAFYGRPCHNHRTMNIAHILGEG